MSFTDRVKGFFHLSVPATVDEQVGVIRVPAFEIPLTPELPEPTECPIEGKIAVEVSPETNAAVVKVALKKKGTKKVVKKAAKKK